MPNSVVIVGAMDTKGAEFEYIKTIIEATGLKTVIVDFGVMGEPTIVTDINRESVAHAAGEDLKHLASGKHKDKAMQVMATGLATVVRQLYEEGKLGGIIGMGGTGGTSIATTAMRTLPVGIPKLMVSTVGGGDVSAYAGTKDITFMPSIVDVAGINSISRIIYSNAANAIVGMLKADAPQTGELKPLIAASMFGNTTEAVNHARQLIEKAGYEVLVFHATGTGGKTMENLIQDGYFTALLDITTTELADFVCGGIFDAGAQRCMAAAKIGIPTVLVPGCVDMANFGALDTVPEKFHSRNLYEWNPNVTLLRTNVEENIQVGEMIAAAANLSTAPVSILLPLKGVSMLDSEGERFWDPEADRACFDTIKANLRSDITVRELAHNINDPAFSQAAAETLISITDNYK